MYKRDFRQLKIWEKSHSLALAVYKITFDFPKGKMFSLVNQMRRSVYSIPANIAEGCVKSKKVFDNHLSIAQGSLEETKYFLILAQDLGYIRKEEFEKLFAQCDEVGRMIYAFIKKSNNFN